MNRTAVLCTCIAALALVGSACLVAGPLNPPAGPVASTFKTIAEVEPRIAINSTNTPGDIDSVYKITVPGSYYLAGNVAGASGKHGIEVLAAGVTIDLMGFRLQGAVGSLDGIATTGGLKTQIVIRNGTISAFGGDGIDLASSGIGTDFTIEDIHAITNQGAGIVAFNHGTVRGCVSRGNGLAGIQVGERVLVESCISALNGSAGISAGVFASVIQCSAIENDGSGIVTPSGIVRSCNAQANGLVGISVTGQGNIQGCSVLSNAGIGISGGVSSYIRDCNTTTNGHHGIQVGSNSHVVGNTCTLNGTQVAEAAGIFSAGTNSRFDSNSCINNNKYSFRLTATDNILIRNTTVASAFGNWNVPAGNYLFVVNATASPTAVTTNAGGISFGTDNPNANFSY